jgi:hypothetical protein
MMTIARPITMMGIITIARLMYACISILLVIAGFFVVIEACGIGYDLIGCHVLEAYTRCSRCGAQIVVGVVASAIVAVCHTAIIRATVSGVYLNMLSNHLCSLVSMCVL